MGEISKSENAFKIPKQVHNSNNNRNFTNLSHELNQVLKNVKLIAQSASIEMFHTITMKDFFRCETLTLTQMMKEFFI